MRLVELLAVFDDPGQPVSNRVQLERTLANALVLLFNFVKSSEKLLLKARGFEFQFIHGLAEFSEIVLMLSDVSVYFEG